MAIYMGKSYTKSELTKRVGDMTQIAGAVEKVLSSGKGRGTRIIDVTNGSGLCFSVVVDRGMDISHAEYKSVPFGFISKTGMVSPAHYDEPKFLDSFTAGLLTTCGLTYMGAACVDEGKALGLHGPIGNTPAYDVAVRQEWEGDDYVIAIRGKLREARVFAQHIVLTREIKIKLGENKIHIHDSIENCGGDAQPYMVLYHYNFGFPLLSEDTQLRTNCPYNRPRDAEAVKGKDIYARFDVPVHGYAEQVFYFDAVPEAQAGLYNPSLGFGVKLSFDGKALPKLIEWKQIGEGDYVVGLEPATWYPEGRAKAREQGELDWIQPGEVKEIWMCLEIDHI